MEEIKEQEEKKCFLRRLAEKIKANKGKTIAITLIAFVLICVIVTLCCLNAYVFNRFATAKQNSPCGRSFPTVCPRGSL